MATRKVKRYNGMSDSDVRSFAGISENESNSGMADRDEAMYEKEPEENFKSSGKAPAKASTKAPIVSKKQLADSGFDNLRDYLNDQKKLTRRGESEPRKPTNAPAKSTTVVKETTTVAPSKGGSGRGGQGGATVDELESYGKQRMAQKQAEYEAAKAKAATPEGRAEREAQVKGQALEQVRPEENLIGAGLGSLKTIAALAKGLANRKGAAGLAEYSTPLLEGGRKALPAPQRLLGMKKGGSVKASKMGSVKTAKPSASSASRRGDGIAQKGKTRGKYL